MTNRYRNFFLFLATSALVVFNGISTSNANIGRTGSVIIWKSGWLNNQPVMCKVSIPVDGWNFRRDDMSGYSGDELVAIFGGTCYPMNDPRTYANFWRKGSIDGAPTDCHVITSMRWDEWSTIAGAFMDLPGDVMVYLFGGYCIPTPPPVPPPPPAPGPQQPAPPIF